MIDEKTGLLGAFAKQQKWTNPSFLLPVDHSTTAVTEMVGFLELSILFTDQFSRKQKQQSQCQTGVLPSPTILDPLFFFVFHPFLCPCFLHGNLSFCRSYTCPFDSGLVNLPESIRSLSNVNTHLLCHFPLDHPLSPVKFSLQTHLHSAS